ncbi:hypothetical protein Barb4_05248 [Bacteroidales bacterium Barb4]|nr:hypothetical protein Barb4_05248 [Bacteroidales bacterium Barb4]
MGVSPSAPTGLSPSAPTSASTGFGTLLELDCGWAKEEMPNRAAKKQAVKRGFIGFIISRAKKNNYQRIVSMYP